MRIPKPGWRKTVKRIRAKGGFDGVLHFQMGVPGEGDMRRGNLFQRTDASSLTGPFFWDVLLGLKKGNLCIERYVPEIGA